MSKTISVPISQKIALTIDEAAEYSNIGQNKLRELVKMPHCPFLLQNGRNILIKRTAFEKYLESRDYI